MELIDKIGIIGGLFLGGITLIGIIVNWIVKKEVSELKAAFVEKIGKIQTIIEKILTTLSHHGIEIDPIYFQSQSPKKITEKGYELLNKLNIGSYLADQCELLEDEELKQKTDVEKFIKCLEWANTKGKEKAVELRFNSNMNQEQSNELLALFILEKLQERLTFSVKKHFGSSGEKASLK